MCFLQDISIVGDGQKWNLIPQWVNGGNITTKDMKMRINLAGLDAAPGVKPGFSRCDAIPQSSAPIVLGPKQVSSVTFLTTPSEPFLGFQRGTIKKLYLWGRATYYDGFTIRPRITRFCFDIISILGTLGIQTRTLECSIPSAPKAIAQTTSATKRTIAFRPQFALRPSSKGRISLRSQRQALNRSARTEILTSPAEYSD
jgi:hypothetical protein